jgi:hypothetical protein
MSYMLEINNYIDGCLTENIVIIDDDIIVHNIFYIKRI